MVNFSKVYSVHLPAIPPAVKRSMPNVPVEGALAVAGRWERRKAGAPGKSTVGDSVMASREIR